MLNYPEWTQLNSFCINSLQAVYNDLNLMPALVSSLLIFTLLSWMTFCHLWPSGGSGIFAPLPKKKKQNNVMIIKWLTYLNLMRVLVIRVQLTTVTPGADLGGGCRGCAPPSPPEMTCDFLIQLVFCEKKNTWFIGVEVQQETGAPPPKKNPGSAPEHL